MVVGLWPRPKSLRRALRCDGIIPEFCGGEGGPDGLRAVRAWLAEHGARPDLDVVANGETPADDAEAAAGAGGGRAGGGRAGGGRAQVGPRRRRSAQVAALAQADATWWLETRWGMPDNMPDRVQDMTERLAAGPPGPARRRDSASAPADADRTAP